MRATWELFALAFHRAIQIRDIVSANGRPAKGATVVQGETVNPSTPPVSDRVLFDTVENFIPERIFQLSLPSSGTRRDRCQ